MADKAQGRISFTPIVSLAADDDGNAADVIHHNIKGPLGGDLTYTAENTGVAADDYWYYAPNVIVTTGVEELMADSTNATDLVGASGDQVNGPNEDVGATLEYTNLSISPNQNIEADGDKIQFMFIKNTGTSDINGTTTTNSIYVTFDDNGSMDHTTKDAIEIGAGEAWMSRINGVNPDEVHVLSGEAKGAGAAEDVNGSTSVRCTVAAIIKNVT